MSEKMEMIQETFDDVGKTVMERRIYQAFQGLLKF